MEGSGFHIGQQIVCIHSHPLKLYRKGETFIVMDIRLGCCSKFSKFILDIGRRHNYIAAYCMCCYHIFYDDILWSDYKNFVPLDEIHEIEVLKKTKPKKLEIAL